MPNDTHAWSTRDWGILCVLALALAGVSFAISAHLVILLEDRGLIDVWFQSDVPFRYAMLTDHTSLEPGSKLHPWLPPMVFIATEPLAMLFGPETACRVWMAVVAGAWAAVLFAVLRARGLARIPAALVTLLGTSSAAAWFWFGLPESFPFGSLLFLVTLGVVMWNERRPVSLAWYVLLAAFDAGVSLTNAMIVFFAVVFRRQGSGGAGRSVVRGVLVVGVAGVLVELGGLGVTSHAPPLAYVVLFAAAVAVCVRFGGPIDRAFERAAAWSARRAVMLPALALATVGLGAVGGLLWRFPSMREAVADRFSHQLRFVLTDASGGVFAVLRSLVYDTIVMPEVYAVPSTWWTSSGHEILLTQRSVPGAGTPFGGVAIVLWTVLLAWGLVRIVRGGWGAFERVLVATLIGQAALHVVYGEETFLYALHFCPLLLLVAAEALRGRAGWPGIALVAGLVLVTAANNAVEVGSTLAALERVAAPPPSARPPPGSAEAPAPEPHDPPGSHAPGEHAHDGAGMRHSFADTERFARVFDAPERDAWQRPEEVVRLLASSPGMRVVDLGAGTGYFLPHLAAAVAPGGAVIGLDVEPNMVAHMRERIEREGITGVSARVVSPDDPGLEAGSVDRVLTVDTWHHLGDRAAYAAKLRRGLRPGGFVLVVDFDVESPRGPPRRHKLPPEQVVAELEGGGFADVSVLEESLPDQYVVRAR